MKVPPSMVLAVAAVLVSPARADDDAWHNVYHSLRGFGQNVKERFTDEHDRSEASDHPVRHHSLRHPRRSARASKDEDSEKPGEASGTPSPTPRHGSKASPTPEPVASPSPAPQEPPKRGSAAANGPKGEMSEVLPAQVSSLPPEALKGYPSQPPKVQQLLRESLLLTKGNLSYKYGSNDPANGGMDCSGFIYYVLRRAGFRDVPRDSSEQYVWVRKNSEFHAVLSRKQDSFELKDLKPGDLLFWSGTYHVDRDIPITHVMIYLGKDNQTGKPLMVGASEGRTYRGERRYGVSVFDFKLPSGQTAKDDPDRTPKFEGYATIPGLRPPDLAQNYEPPNHPPSASPTPRPKPLSNGD